MATVEEFERLREECLAEEKLYHDPDFPAVMSSMYYSYHHEDIEWRRPKEFCDDPKFFVEGATRFDVNQGKAGDCWFVAALASLTFNNQALHQVAPKEQNFTEKYAGIFHFRFWQYGHWVTVIVDDRLPWIPAKDPTTNGVLKFMESSQNNEFWSALLEKAYAKLYGSYEAIEWGIIGAGLEDLTGGLTEKIRIINLEDKPDELFSKMLQAYKRGSLMGAAVYMEYQELSKRRKQLTAGHAYSITCVRVIKTSACVLRMVRVRNPYGKTDENEWDGAWSDTSCKWATLSEEVKNELEFKDKNDGEFWMEIEDFCKNFHDLYITHFNPGSNRDYLTGNTWEVEQFEGKWEKEVSDGGCIKHSETFHMNPQYRITLHKQDAIVEGDEDDGVGNESTTNDGAPKCTVIVSLMQKNRRSLKEQGKSNLTIGFSIFKIPDPETAPKRLDKSFFEENGDMIIWAKYEAKRAYTLRCQLSPGTYCVVPTTYDRLDEWELEEGKQEVDFLLRTISEKIQPSD